jgi:hypothetical protein
MGVFMTTNKSQKWLKRIFLTVGLLALLVGGISAMAQAPTDQLPPAIVRLGVDLPSVSLRDIEAGVSTANVSWKVVGFSDRFRILLYYYQNNNWQPVDRQGESLPPEAGARVPVFPTFDFSPPAYRLAVLDRTGNIISQQFLLIPYDPNQEAFASTIEEFNVLSEGIDPVRLNNRTSQLEVTWRIGNRLPNANLVFEQVFADGSARSVELPRANRWIPSQGRGAVLPTAEQGATVVRIRLRIIDMRTNNIYAEQVRDIPIGIRATSTPLQPLSTATPLGLQLIPSPTPSS